MSGECNYCGGEHAEQACDADRAMVYRNGYASGEAAGSNELYPQLTRLRAECERLTRERDEARANLAGVVAEKPGPTAWAYEQACKARDADRARATLLEAAIERSGMDVSPCRTCGEAVVCVPDGMSSMCEKCADKAGALGGA